MPREKHYYQQLLKRYLNNDCTPQEAEELLDYLQQDESNRMLLEEIKASFVLPQEQDAAQPAPWSNRVRQELLAQVQPVKVVPLYRRWLPKVAAAALILACAGLGWLYFTHTKSTQPLQTAVKKTSQQELLPGSNKAVLTLANGSRIVLDDAGHDTISGQGAAKIINTKGLLTYQAGDTAVATVQYNTLTTPRGGQYKIVLPDGTLVWLNAASSLRFPTAFSGRERAVELHGEGYFEVAHQRLPDGSRMPFKVQAGNGAVEVLGTHFNIMAYPNEARVKTTLLQGAVRVTYGAQAARLLPGQQASWATAAAGKIQVAEVDTDEAVSWKEGYFQFNRAGLDEVMRQLQRWYNIEVRYEGAAGKREFWGKIPRNVKLNEALSILELSNIHYSMEGDTIIIHE